MGFEENKPVAPSGQTSVLDELLGKKPEQPPISAPKREFVLDQKYLKNQDKKEDPFGDDFLFGDYAPSAAATNSRQTSAKRGVRFEDEDHPAATSNNRPRRFGGSYLDDLLAKDDSDWLEMATSGKDPELQKTTPQKTEPQKTTPQKTEPQKTTPQQSLDQKPKADVTNTSRSSKGLSGDWLSISDGKDDWLDDLNIQADPFAKKPQPIKTPDAHKERGDAPKPIKTPESQPKQLLDASRGDVSGAEPTSKADDDDDDDAWLSRIKAKRNNTKQSNDSSDWLGLGQEIDLDDFDIGPVGKKPVDDLFKASPAKDTRSPFPWESDASRRDSLQGKETLDAVKSDIRPVSADVSTKRQATSQNERVTRSVEGPLNAQDPLWGDGIDPSLERSGTSHANQGSFANATLTLAPGAMQEPTNATMPDQAGHGATEQGRHKSDGASEFSNQSSPYVAAHLSNIQSSLPAGGPPVVTQAWSSPNPPPATPHPSQATPQLSQAAPYQLQGSTNPLQATPHPSQLQSWQQMPSANGSSLLGPQNWGSPGPPMQAWIQSSWSGPHEPPLAHSSPYSQGTSLTTGQPTRSDQQERQQVELQRHLAASRESFISSQNPVVSNGYGWLPSLYAPPGTDILGQIQRLEMDKRHLESVLSTCRIQHEDQLKILEESYQKRLLMFEETFGKREIRLKEECERLAEELVKGRQQWEVERTALLASHREKHEEWQRLLEEEINKVKDKHRAEKERLRREQEEALENLRTFKDQQIDTVANSHLHTKSLQEVMSHVQASSRDLGHLQHQLEEKHQRALVEQQEEIKQRDCQLKTLEERLSREKQEMSEEKTRLSSLIVALESRLKDQAGQSVEETWRLRQEETRISVQQRSMELEQKRQLEMLAREKEELDKARTSLLDEQKFILTQLCSERRALADERAQFNLTQRLKQEKEQRETLRTAKMEVEVDSSLKALTSEQRRLDELVEMTMRDKEKVDEERVSLEKERQKVKEEKEQLGELALDLRQKTKELHHLSTVASQMRDTSERALQQAHETEARLQEKMMQLQQEQTALRRREKHFTEEKLNLVRTRATQNLCASCRQPVKLPAPSASHQTSTEQSQLAVTSSDQLSPAAAQLLASLDPDLQARVTSLKNVSSQMERDRSIRLWTISARKDKTFLENEAVFLEALQRTTERLVPSSEFSRNHDDVATEL